MMAKVHYWVVCDAASYIKSHGTDLQTRALQAFENAYGNGRVVQECPAGGTALEFLAGSEARHTDKFGDLSLAIRALPWGAKTHITGLGWHKFTAFNHFINPFPLQESRWSVTDGYSYESSSKGGVDVAVMKGISDLLRGGVDPVHSLVVPRIGEHWTGGESAWSGSSHENLAQTVFAPWNVLAQFYYSQLLHKHFEPLEVNGPNQSIVGLQLLGPVLHAAADACSPQHVRPALGLGHQVWENFLQSKLHHRAIGLEPEIVAQILSEEPFLTVKSVTEGQMRGAFDVQSFLLRLAAKTAATLQSSWSAKSWTEIWEAGPDFWKRYLSSERMNYDARLLYNQAVAGTAHLVAQSFADLVRVGALDPEGGLKSSSRLPDLPLVQRETADSLSMSRRGEEVPSEESRKIPLLEARNLIGFDPMDGGALQAALDDVNKCFAALESSGGDKCDLQPALANLEDNLTRRFLKAAEVRGSRFCPISSIENNGLDADVSAHFGLGTFRLPSLKECDDPALFRSYMEAVNHYEFKASKIQLTQCLAALQSYADRFGALGSWESDFQTLLGRIRAERDRGLPRPGADCRPSVGSLISSGVEAATKIQRETTRRAESISRSVSEWFGSLFSIPVAAFATAALTLLVAVSVFKGGAEPPTMARSIAKWESKPLSLMAPQAHTKGLEATRPKLAVVVYLRNFTQPVPEGFVDGLYNAAKPPVHVLRKYDALSPADVTEAAQRGTIPGVKRPDAAERLFETLGLSRGLLITVEKSGALFNVEAEMNVAGRGVVGAAEKRGLTEAELSGEITRMASALLNADAANEAGPSSTR
jgi:hypothetical protein